MFALRAATFVNNSNGLANTPSHVEADNCENLDKDILVAAVSKKQLPKNVDGTLCAYKLSEIKAKEKQPLTVEDVSIWDNFITGQSHHIDEETIKKLNAYLEGLNEKLQASTSQKMDEIGVCEFLAKSYRDFLAIHPYEDGSSLRIARIIINYALNWMKRPIIVFKMEEKAELEKASQNENQMRLYFAKKIKEAVHIKDTTYELKKDYGASARYFDISSGKEIVVEWHDLVRKEYEWKKSV